MPESLLAVLLFAFAFVSPAQSQQIKGDNLAAKRPNFIIKTLTCTPGWSQFGCPGGDEACCPNGFKHNYCLNDKIATCRP
jgi:hypothetical protein